MSLSLHLAHSAPASVETPLLVIVLPQPPVLDTALLDVDRALGGALSRSILRRDFRGGRDETMLVIGGDSGTQRALMVGRGALPLTRTSARRAAAIGARQAMKLGTGAMHVYVPDATDEAVEGLAIGAAAGAWEYTDLRTPPPETERRLPLTSATRSDTRRNPDFSRPIG